MNPNLEKAIAGFIANEFHLDAEDITQDTNFNSEFGLNSDQTAELLQRLQDALSFTLPEEIIPEIKTVGDIYTALESDPETTEDL